jgi:hypothetical protein
MKRLFLVVLLFLATGLSAQTFWGRYIHICSLQYQDLDAGGPEAYWTITAGNTPKVFVITPCSGDVRVDSAVYTTFITQKTFTLTFRSTDQAGIYATQKRKITLKKDTAGKRITSIVLTVL